MTLKTDPAFWGQAGEILQSERVVCLLFVVVFLVWCVGCVVLCCVVLCCVVLCCVCV